MIASCQTDFSIYCSFFLFEFRGESYELNLVGTLAPIIAAIFFVAILRGRGLGQIAKYSILLGALFTIAWCASDAVTGEISTPGSAVVVILLVTSFTWLYYNPSSIKKATVNSVVLRTYATGTFGVFFADLSRTFGSIFAVPFLSIRAQHLIIGGAGPSDGVFLGGLFLVFFLLYSNIVLRWLNVKYKFEFGAHSKKIADWNS